MFSNYLRSLYRNIISNKFYTILNVTGLGVGFATTILILLYIQDELGYDKHHLKHKRIYRIESDIAVSGKHNLYATAPIPFAPTLKVEMPEVEQFVRLDPIGNILFRYNESEHYEDNFFLADSTVFEVFTHAFVFGNPEKSLSEPNTIVLTRKTSEKYFGKKNPVGEILISGGGENYKVTGVIEDLPGNSHLKYDGLVSISTEAETYSTMKPSRFWRIGAYTFLLLNENASVSDVFDKFPDFYNKYMKATGDQYNVRFTLMATPLAKTHFRQGLGAERPSGNMAYVTIFSIVAAFILALAAINYMNMATARSANRAKEVGIRKVLGSDRGTLVRQFVSESVILSLIALLIACLLVMILMPDFNDFTGKLLSLNPGRNPAIYLEILLIALTIGLVSGSYPAFYLSSFQPVSVLKGKVSKSGHRSGLLRKVLVVIQFFIAIFMIIGTLIVSEQLSFLRNKDLGFNKENLVVMEIQDNEFRSGIPAFKDELLRNSDVVSVSNSTGIPGITNWIQTMRIEQKTGMEEQAILLAQCDYDFAGTLQLQFLQGRNFDKNMGMDALEAVIINQTAADEFGWGDDAIGKKIHFGYGQDNSGGRMMKVIGVVKDFHFKSLHNVIEPFIFFLQEQPSFLLTSRVNNGTLDGSLRFIGQKWTDFGVKQPFNYRIMSETMDEMYVAENKIARLIRIATLITIFIALLGLFGLSSFIAEQKTKEMGIRKIHGATIENILALLYKDFSLLILISFVLAVPIAWWRLSIWLETNFIYYLHPQWYNFVLAGILSFVIGLGTISYYVIKVASRNPVEAIKYE
jgi:putative ABC transport system permease protein